MAAPRAAKGLIVTELVQRKILGGSAIEAYRLPL